MYFYVKMFRKKNIVRERGFQFIKIIFFRKKQAGALSLEYVVYRNIYSI